MVSRLLELEAKVVQIQLFIWVSLRYLISVDQQDLGHLQTLLWFPIVLNFRTFLSVDFIYSVYPCSIETSRGSILILWSFYTMFTLCPFETKRGRIC
jgi:hypothetical protein